MMANLEASMAVVCTNSQTRSGPRHTGTEMAQATAGTNASPKREIPLLDNISHNWFVVVDPPIARVIRVIEGINESLHCRMEVESRSAENFVFETIG